MCKNVFEDTTDDNNVVSLPDFDTFHEGLIIDLGVNFHMDIKGIYDHIKKKYTAKTWRSRKMGIQRYDMDVTSSDLGAWSVEEESDDGEWVKYKDVQSRLTELEKQNAEMVDRTKVMMGLVCSLMKLRAGSEDYKKLFEKEIELLERITGKSIEEITGLKSK
jgi:hypothetical protein